jgi:hypothetical protein
MTSDYVCNLCGLDHLPPKIYESCPHAGRSPESLARLHAKREAKEQNGHCAELMMTNQRNLAQLKATLQQQDEAEQGERSLAILKAQLAKLRRDAQAKQQAAGEATMHELHHLLVGGKFVAGFDARQRVRRLVEKFGS